MLFRSWNGKHAGKVISIINEDTVSISVPERHNGKDHFCIGIESVERLYTEEEHATALRAAEMKGFKLGLEAGAKFVEEYHLERMPDKSLNWHQRHEEVTATGHLVKKETAKAIRALNPSTVIGE